MKLILTRHGETEENKNEIIQGQGIGRLSDEGRNQAKKVALRLKGEQINYIYSSDLERAVDTTESIAMFHKKTPIKFTKEVCEIYLGSYQGKRRADVIGPKWPKDGESFEELYNRAKGFLNGLLLKHKNDTILVVGHNQFNRALFAVITGQEPEDIEKIEKSHNTSISIFEIDASKNYKVLLFNNTNHLD